ncbi:hypothetical protein RUND412_001085 [Rhizina undulata]
MGNQVFGRKPDPTISRESVRTSGSLGASAVTSTLTSTGTRNSRNVNPKFMVRTTVAAPFSFLEEQWLFLHVRVYYPLGYGTIDWDTVFDKYNAQFAVERTANSLENKWKEMMERCEYRILRVRTNDAARAPEAQQAEAINSSLWTIVQEDWFMLYCFKNIRRIVDEGNVLEWYQVADDFSAQWGFIRLSNSLKTKWAMKMDELEGIIRLWMDDDDED